MKLNFFIFTIVLTFGFIANAGFCSFLLTSNPLVQTVKKYNLPKISRTTQSNQGKLIRSGEVLSNTEEINSFLQTSSPNDTFPFIISSKGKFVTSSRVTEQTLESSTQGEIAAHYSLLNKLKQSDRKDFPIASGEFRKRNNKVYLISNKSGLFRGGSVTLDLIKDYFRHIELSNQEVIEFRDYSKYKYPDDHLIDKRYGQNAYIINSDIKKRILINEIEKIYHNYYLLFPDLEKPGHVDIESLSKLVEKINFNFEVDPMGYLNIFNQEGLYFYKNLEEIQNIYHDFKYIRNVLAAWKVLGKI